MRNFKNYRRGSAIVAWALLIPVLLGLVGIVIDVGAAYADRTRLQHVGDAAALAGAAKIKDEAVSTALATAYIAKNHANADNPKITFEPKTISFVDKDGKTKTKTLKKINVDFQSQSPTYFLRIFRYESIPIGIHAAAVGPEDPNPFDFALVSAGDQEFTLFGKGAPADNRYQGSVWANGPVKIDDGKAVHTENQLTGSLVTASPHPPSDISDHKLFADQVKTDYEKIKIDTEGTNKNTYVEDFVNDIMNKSNTYSSAHPSNKDGAIDYTKLNGPLYVDGNFNKNTLISPNNTFEIADNIVIVANGDISLTDAVVTNKNAKIILCSLTGNITFNGRIDNFPNVVFLAPRGKINLNCSTTHITGTLIGQEVEVGNAGNLQIKNDGTSDNDKFYYLRLVE